MKERSLILMGQGKGDDEQDEEEDDMFAGEVKDLDKDPLSR